MTYGSRPFPTVRIRYMRRQLTPLPLIGIDRFSHVGIPTLLLGDLSAGWSTEAAGNRPYNVTSRDRDGCLW